MIKKIKNLLITGLSLSVLLSPVLVPATAHAQASVNNGLTQNLCTGVDKATSNGGFSLNGTQGADSSCTSDTNAGNSLGNILTAVINIMSIVIGAVAVIMIIIGGFKYVTSGGNDSNVASAKNTIIYAIVGLIIVALAQVIVHFVLTRLSA